MFDVTIRPHGFFEGGKATFASFNEALRFAALCGVRAHYECDDGRTFLYASQEDCDLAENGVEIGAIEEHEDLVCAVCSAPYDAGLGCDCGRVE